MNPMRRPFLNVAAASAQVVVLTITCLPAAHAQSRQLPEPVLPNTPATSGLDTSYQLMRARTTVEAALTWRRLEVIEADGTGNVNLIGGKYSGDILIVNKIGAPPQKQKKPS